MTRRRLPVTDAPSAEQIRDWLRASVTIVKPGETLVIRCPASWAPSTVRELGDFLRVWSEDAGDPFRYVILPPVGLAVAEQVPGDDFATRVAQAFAHPVVADALHMALLRGGPAAPTINDLRRQRGLKPWEIPECIAPLDRLLDAPAEGAPDAPAQSPGDAP